jgi:MFS family permease
MYYRKQIILYISEFLTSASFTILAAFYPGLAEEKGIPLWLIGFVFSLDPILGLPTSYFAGKHMNRIGRKNLLTIGMAFGACGIFLIGMIEYTHGYEAILMSFASRIFAGIGAGCSMVATSAILVIEYPDEVDKVIGYYEAASGLGLLLGPILGSVMSMISISISFSAAALLWAVYSFMSHKLLGKLSTAVIVSTPLPYRQLLCRPVFFI